MQTETESGEKGTIEFIDVAGWDLSPFNEQNQLFEFHEYDGHTLPDWIKSDFNIPKEYLDELASGNKKLFFLDASNGMGGYVIAGSLMADYPEYLDQET
jgi:hypothetical protein